MWSNDSISDILYETNTPILWLWISNVYVCGSANHLGPGVFMAPWRNVAQVIYADLGLDFRNLAIQ
jgi:phytoene dehydrogenase-like protein